MGFSEWAAKYLIYLLSVLEIFSYWLAIFLFNINQNIVLNSQKQKIQPSMLGDFWSEKVTFEDNKWSGFKVIII